ncbi:MAG: hypothetical protein KJ056_05835 [Acidimicrobiia bacterium]|nr:hypothetical protein [Acidimicrobiia bacterium]
MLEAVEATDGWATSVRASEAPFTIMGTPGGVEAGLRQMRRTHPLETEQVDRGGGARVVEILSDVDAYYADRSGDAGSVLTSPDPASPWPGSPSWPAPARHA